jgi:hypothetical protein
MEELDTAATRLAQITAAITALEAEGVLRGRLELVAPGGTAGAPSQRTPKYGRLRQGRGSDRTSTYIPLAGIAETQAAINRGREVKALKKQAKALQAKPVQSP